MKTASFFLLVFVLLAGCSSIKVEHNYDDAVDFAPYKTFAFHEESIEVEGTAASRVAVVRAIKDEIENELTSDGYQESKDSPDFFVAFHASVIDPVSVNYNPGRRRRLRAVQDLRLPRRIHRGRRHGGVPGRRRPCHQG